MGTNWTAVHIINVGDRKRVIGSIGNTGRYTRHITGDIHAVLNIKHVEGEFKGVIDFYELDDQTFITRLVCSTNNPSDLTACAGLLPPEYWYPLVEAGEQYDENSRVYDRRLWELVEEQYYDQIADHVGQAELEEVSSVLRNLADSLERALKLVGRRTK